MRLMGQSRFLALQCALTVPKQVALSVACLLILLLHPSPFRSRPLFAESISEV